MEAETHRRGEDRRRGDEQVVEEMRRRSPRLRWNAAARYGGVVMVALGGEGELRKICKVFFCCDPRVEEHTEIAKAVLLCVQRPLPSQTPVAVLLTRSGPQ